MDCLSYFLYLIPFFSLFFFIFWVGSFQLVAYLHNHITLQRILLKDRRNMKYPLCDQRPNENQINRLQIRNTWQAKWEQWKLYTPERDILKRIEFFRCLFS